MDSRLSCQTTAHHVLLRSFLTANEVPGGHSLCRPSDCARRIPNPSMAHDTPALYMFEMTFPKTSIAWTLSMVGVERKLVSRRHSKLQHTKTLAVNSRLFRGKSVHWHPLA